MTDEEASLADGALRIAIRRMVKEYPFHAHLLSPGSFVSDPAVATMGVTVSGGRIQFRYAPSFVLRCTFDKLAGMFQHVINHLLFGHVVADPEEYPDSDARLVAEEVTANEWVTAPLPGQPLTLDQFPALKSFDNTKERYAYLARKTVNQGRKTGPSARKTGPMGRKMGLVEPKSVRGGPESEPLRWGVEQFTLLDDHSIWGEARENSALGKLVIVSALAHACQALDDSQWQALPRGLREKIDELTAGQSAGGISENVSNTDRAGVINWRTKLRRYIAQTAVPRPTFHRPPRRMPELVGVLPAQCRLSVKPVVMAVLDTSASMTLALIRTVDAELRMLAQDYQVTVVECDAAVQVCYPFQGNLRMVHGRGGTDFRPPFERQFLAKIRPDIIVYFTDGDGPAPDRKPRTPVVWCLTPLGSRPVPWGREVRMASQ